MYMIGQEDQMHFMFKLRDGDAETGAELGTCLVLHLRFAMKSPSR